MRKIFIDLNIILDVLLARQPFLGSSQRLLDLIVRGEVKGFVSAASMLNLYYIVQKQLTPPLALEHLRKMIHLFSIVEINKDILERAMHIRLVDYEDSVQAACAERCGAQFIITRNLKDFKGSPVSILSPEKYLENDNDRGQN